MIVEYIRYQVEATRVAEFAQAYAAAGEVLERDPHCLGYEVSQGATEPTHLVVRIEWDSSAGHLEGFRQDPAFADFFALVQPYVADVEEMSHYDVLNASPARPEQEPPTLFDWCGGQSAVQAMINAFYDRVERDDLLGPFFPGGVGADHREHVAVWWAEVLGGPAAYTELGGYPRMLAHHLDLDIGAEQRLRFVTLMSLGADDAGLPDDPEFRAALMGYLEWGTRLAMANSRTGATVAREAPVPRWGWGVAPPYQG